MARISNVRAYPTQAPAGSDLMVYTDGSNSNKTRTCTISQAFSGGSIVTSKSQITTLEFFTFNNVPTRTIELIEAPGENKLISIVKAQVYYDFSSVAFDFSANLTLAADGSASPGPILSSADLNTTSDIFTDVSFPTTPLATLGVNEALTLRWEDQATGGTITQGDTTMNLYLWYSVIDLS